MSDLGVFGQLHRTHLEFRNTTNGIQSRIGQLVGRALGKVERDEDRAIRSFARNLHLGLNGAPPGGNRINGPR